MLAKLQVEAAKASAGYGGEQARAFQELRERVAVLERIVTDGGYRLGHEIERLRDAEPSLEDGRKTQ